MSSRRRRGGKGRRREMAPVIEAEWVEVERRRLHERLRRERAAKKREGRSA
jgi:hypothetical protein